MLASFKLHLQFFSDIICIKKKQKVVFSLQPNCLHLFSISNWPKLTTTFIDEAFHSRETQWKAQMKNFNNFIFWKESFLPLKCLFWPSMDIIWNWQCWGEGGEEWGRKGCNYSEIGDDDDDKGEGDWDWCLADWWQGGTRGKERSLWDTGVSEPWLREFPIQLGSKKLGFSFIFLEWVTIGRKKFNLPFLQLMFFFYKFSLTLNWIFRYKRLLSNGRWWWRRRERLDHTWR